MAKTFFKTVKSSVKYWWVSLIIGLLFITLGTYCFIYPTTTYIALSSFFAVAFLFSGIAEIIFSVSNKDHIDNWGWMLAYGILTTVVGFMLVTNEILTLQVFSFYVGFLILFRSISGISYAFDLKNYGVKDWGVSLFFAVLGLILSFILISYPQLAGLTAVAWLGLSIISAGFFAIFISLQLKKLKDILPKNAPEELKRKYNEIRRELENFDYRE